MNITAFGKILPLEQHLWDAANTHRDKLSSDTVNLMLLAYAKLEVQQLMLQEAQEREQKMLERLEKIESRLQRKERRWMVRGEVNYTPYMSKPQQRADIRIITAPTREEAERLFVEHWDSKSQDHGDSYWATVTDCQEELG